MKYIKESSFYYDVDLKVYNNLEDAINDCIYEIDHTSKKDLNNSDWFIYAVSDDYASDFLNDNSIDFVSDVYNFIWSAPMGKYE